MIHRLRFAVVAVGLTLVHAIASQGTASDDFSFYHENVLGTSLELFVRADSREAARRAESCILTEIDRLSAIFSGYDPASEFAHGRPQARQQVRCEFLRSFTKYSRRVNPGLLAAAALRSQSGCAVATLETLRTTGPAAGDRGNGGWTGASESSRLVA